MSLMNLISRSLFAAVGDLLYGAGANTPARLSGNTTTTRKFLRQTGNGSASAAPAWDTLVAGDLPQHPGTILDADYNDDTSGNTTASTTPVDLTTVQEISFTLVSASNVLLTCSADMSNDTAPSISRLDIWDGSANTRVVRSNATAANALSSGCGQAILSLGSGTHTFRLRFSVSAGTGTFRNRCIKAEIVP